MATGFGGPDGLDGGGFSILDPKLTIFALANGMDLEKAPSTRKLTWFRDGLERGLLLSASADGQISVMALAWKRGDLAAALQRLWFAALITLLVVVAVFAYAYRGPWLAPLAIGLGVWVMAAALQDLFLRAKFGEVPFATALARLTGLPRSAWGTAVAHFGLGVMVVGIAATSAYRQEKILVMAPEQSVSFAGYELTFKGVFPATGPNYNEQRGRFDISVGDTSLMQLFPAKRIYRASRQNTTEAGIHASPWGDLYVVLGDPKQGGAFAVSLYYNPLVRLIWIGCVIMFLGGVVSLSDRRLRVGAPRRATRMREPHGEPA